MKQSIQLVGRKLTITTGAEGPSHDPYSYEEWEVVYKRKTIVLHIGLGVRLTLNSRDITAKRGSHKDREDATIAKFEKMVGFTIGDMNKWMHRMKSRCKCGSYHLEQQAGYPGETFTVCSKCGNVVDTMFSLSAVE